MTPTARTLDWRITNVCIVREHGAIRSIAFTVPLITTKKNDWRPWRGRIVQGTKSRAQMKALRTLIMAHVRGTFGASAVRCSFIVNMAVRTVTVHVDREDHFHVPTRPDIDNIVTTYLDAMRGLVFDDDDQVTQILAHKLGSFPILE